MSKAENPVRERVLRTVQSAATCGGSGEAGVEWLNREWHREEGTLRQRAERRLFELEAMAACMAAQLGEESPRGRLLACRWAAARALFLEVLEAYDPQPRDRQPVASPWEQHEETGLLGALCRRHGWRCVRPGLLARIGGAPDA